MSSIRKATIADTPYLKELIQQLGSPDVTDRIMENRLQMIEGSQLDSMYVYADADEVQAAIVLRKRESIREVSTYLEVVITVVSNHSKRLGYGRKLMEFAEKIALAEGCKTMYLISGFQRKNEAHLFYKELGYAITGYRFEKQLS
jgi:GNAT superfamily N-acetyltransferase